MVVRRGSPQIKFCVINLDDYVREDDIYRVLDRELDFSFIQPLVETYYRNGRGAGGRPAEDPERMFRQLFLMHRERLRSERQLEEDTRANLRFRWFCGYELDEPIPDHSTFCWLRARLGPAVFDEMLTKIIGQALEKGYLCGDITVDRTDMAACETPLSNRERALVIVREIVRTIEVAPAVEKIISERGLGDLTNEAKNLLASVITDLARVDKRSKARVIKELMSYLDGTRNSEKSKGMAEVIAGWRIDECLGGVLRKVVIDLRGMGNKISNQVRRELAQVIDEIVKVMPLGKAGGFARFGCASDHRKFWGHNVMMVIDNKFGFVTAADNILGNRHGFEGFDEIYGAHKRRCGKPQSVRADSEFDQPRIRDALAGDGAVAYIPQQASRVPKGKMGVEHFRFNERGVLTCPYGREMVLLCKGKQEIWQGVDCKSCSLKDRCLGGEGNRKVNINREAYERRQAITLFNATEEFRAEMKRRLLIDSRFGHAKGYHHLGKALYWKWANIRIQTKMEAIVLNCERMAFLARKKDAPRSTQVKEIEGNTAVFNDSPSKIFSLNRVDCVSQTKNKNLFDNFYYSLN